MPAKATLEELEAAQLALELIKADSPECYDKFKNFIKQKRSIGYRNICRLILEETTPKKLKGLD